MCFGRVAGYPLYHLLPRSERSPHSGWGPLRSNQFIWGIPGLSPLDTAKMRAGNGFLRVSVRVVQLCVALGTPVALENPASSMLWLTPPMKRLRQHPACLECVCDFCQFKARWRNRTRVLCWHLRGASNLHRKCSGRGGVCSSSGKYHIVLSGRDPKSNRLWTAIAQPYPTGFAAAFASAFEETVETLQLARLGSFSFGA